MNIFTQIVLLVGKVMPDHIQPIGTGILIKNDGLVATTMHVVGSEESNIVVLIPNMDMINNYQDLSDNKCKTAPGEIVEIDPIRDISIIKTKLNFDGKIPEIGNFDNVDVGEEVGIFGFPHCIEGRRCLTFQKAEIGAKVLLESSGIKSKYAVINTQSRPGQSGSLIFDPRKKQISGILIGAWAPSTGGISIGGINPRELHQTTHCISAEYIKEMI